jgi:hypothetical protein
MGQGMSLYYETRNQKQDRLEVSRFTDKFLIKVYGVNTKDAESERQFILNES